MVSAKFAYRSKSFTLAPLDFIFVTNCIKVEPGSVVECDGDGPFDRYPSAGLQVNWFDVHLVACGEGLAEEVNIDVIKVGSVDHSYLLPQTFFLNVDVESSVEVLLIKIIKVVSIGFIILGSFICQLAGTSLSFLDERKHFSKELHHILDLILHSFQKFDLVFVRMSFFLTKHQFERLF